MAVHEQFISDPRYGGRKEAKEALLGPMLAHLGEHVAFQYRQQMQMAVDQVSGQPIQLPMPDFDETNNTDENEQEMPIEMENQLAEFEAQSVQLLAQSQPQDPAQVKEQRMAASDEAQIALKQEEMGIRKERFVAGEKNNERVQSRKDKEFQLKAVELMAKQKNNTRGK